MTRGEISVQIRDERGKWSTLGDATDIAVEYYNRALEEAASKVAYSYDAETIRALKID